MLTANHPLRNKHLALMTSLFINPVNSKEDEQINICCRQRRTLDTSKLYRADSKLKGRWISGRGMVWTE